jgi:cytochrome c oxidase cbb3-type subunit 3
VTDEFDAPRRTAAHPATALWVFVGIALVGVLAALILVVWPPSAGPPPQEIAADPLLVRGREVFLDRCASCHGRTGRGDGPTAAYVKGPPVGNLTDEKWKHGDSPDAVLAVIRLGAPDSQMPGWGRLLDPADVKAVAGFVYHLGGRPVPDVLRAGD